ncbi:Hypothetical predicted protein [Mytilus galloprovincialis]|uniref:Uncharacterized protein n=1 Tax=Mytilus galloprovincialis TaxID=29158 RepID=A0A8B6EC69_MYTGA|nr:Hypothetical predicted protein [Mytilus galloprovincialis]
MGKSHSRPSSKSYDINKEPKPEDTENGGVTEKSIKAISDDQQCSKRSDSCPDIHSDSGPVKDSNPSSNKNTDIN